MPSPAPAPVRAASTIAAMTFSVRASWTMNVMSAFGRCGEWFAWQRYGEDGRPDIMTLAKGLTNGAIPMGAVLVSKPIYEAFMQGPEGIELFHGYTYSAHPAACAAGLATLGIYEREGLMTRAKTLAAQWEAAAHSLRGLPHVIDIRNYGLIGAVELEPRPGKVGSRGFDVFLKCFERGIMVRQTGDTIAMSPPLIIEQKQIDIAPLITHRYTSFGDVEKALSTDIHEPNYVKGVVVLAADLRG